MLRLVLIGLLGSAAVGGGFEEEEAGGQGPEGEPGAERDVPIQRSQEQARYEQEGASPETCEESG